MTSRDPNALPKAVTLDIASHTSRPSNGAHTGNHEKDDGEGGKPKVGTGLRRFRSAYFGIIAIVVVGACVILFLLTRFPNLHKATVLIGAKNDKSSLLKIDLDNDNKIDSEALLDKLWSQEWTRDALVARVSREKRMYQLESLPESQMSGVVDMLWKNDAWRREISARAKRDGEWYAKSEMLAKYKDVLSMIFSDTDVATPARWFARKFQLYIPEDPKLPDYLADLLPDKLTSAGKLDFSAMDELLSKQPMLVKLRDNARAAKAPFQIIAHRVQISRPDNRNQPPSHCCVVDYHSEFAGKFVRIFESDPEQSLVLYAGLFLEDRPGLKTDIQLNTAQIRCLFGSDLVQPTKLAYAVVEPQESVTFDHTNPTDTRGKSLAEAASLADKWRKSRR